MDRGVAARVRVRKGYVSCRPEKLVHPLVLEPASRQEYRQHAWERHRLRHYCDLCGRQQPPQFELHMCGEGCDFDVCAECFSVGVDVVVALRREEDMFADLL